MSLHFIFYVKCRFLWPAFFVFMLLFSMDAQDKIPMVLILSGHTAIEGNRGTSTYSGKWENEFNDGVVNLFSNKENQLESLEYILVPSTQNLSLQDKICLAMEVKPDLYIEIHHDSGSQEDIDKAKLEGKDSLIWDSMKGFCILYYDDGDEKESKFPKESLKFAELLSAEMVKEGFTPNKYHAFKQGMKLIAEDRGIYNRIRPNSLFVLRNAISPAVLLECGFVMNPNEEKILEKPETRQKIIDAINCAISEYFQQNIISEP